MRIEALKMETLGQINKNFAVKVQLEEQLEDNEVQLHYRRGQMDAWAKVQQLLRDLQQSEEIAQIEKNIHLGQKPTSSSPVSSGDGQGDPNIIPLEGVERKGL